VLVSCSLRSRKIEEKQSVFVYCSIFCLFSSIFLTACGIGTFSIALDQLAPLFLLSPPKTLLYFLPLFLLPAKLVLKFEIGKMGCQKPYFCKVGLPNMQKICYKTYFFAKTFGHIRNMQYFCTVFFMVLDFKVK